MSLAVASVTSDSLSLSTSIADSSAILPSDAEMLAAAFLSRVGIGAMAFARKHAVELAAANRRHAAEFWRRVLAHMERLAGGGAEASPGRARHSSRLGFPELES